MSASRANRYCVSILLVMAVLALPAMAQEGSTTPSESPLPAIACYSGSPLLMEITVPAGSRTVESITIRSDASAVSYFSPRPEPESQAIDLVVAPFLKPGVYDLDIGVTTAPDGEPALTAGNTVSTAGTAAGDTRHFRIRVGFVDFVFGRDNLSFGNNASFESDVGTYGEVLQSWTTDRFGALPETDLVLLSDYMYGMFGARSGRCYAFAGTELLYWLWPDLLPSYYHKTYDLRGSGRVVQTRMNYLQLDMAFHHFTSSSAPFGGSPAAEMDTVRRDVLAEVAAIRARIDSRIPVVAGFIGPSLHHAMLVYGYISRPEAGYVDLLVANNWKDDEDLNLRSRDAETVRVFTNAETLTDMFEWRYSGGTRNRPIDRLFIVDVERDFTPDRSGLDAIIAARRQVLESGGRAIVVVEDASAAWLTDGTHVTGYKDRRTLLQIGGVVLDRLDRAYRFEYPSDSDLSLGVTTDSPTRVLVYRPARSAGDADPAAEFAWIFSPEPPVDGESVTRLVNLSSANESADGPVQPSVATATDQPDGR